jgi:methylglyoxal synthase
MTDQARKRKRIALVAHDHKKEDLLTWVRARRKRLSRHELVATGTTGALLEQQLGLRVRKLQSGPLGGDLEMGALITEGKIDWLIFFWDPLEPQPHDPDVKALLRVAVVWNVPLSCNTSSADLILDSPLLAGKYVPVRPTYDAHKNRLRANSNSSHQ